jgi:hypothetical protein
MTPIVTGIGSNIQPIGRTVVIMYTDATISTGYLHHHKIILIIYYNLKSSITYYHNLQNVKFL